MSVPRAKLGKYLGAMMANTQRQRTGVRVRTVRHGVVRVAERRWDMSGQAARCGKASHALDGIRRRGRRDGIRWRGRCNESVYRLGLDGKLGLCLGL